MKKRSIQKILCVLLTLLLIPAAFSGCQKDDSASWDFDTDSLIDFPWGCDIETALTLLKLDGKTPLMTQEDEGNVAGTLYYYDATDTCPEAFWVILDGSVFGMEIGVAQITLQVEGGDKLTMTVEEEKKYIETYGETLDAFHERQLEAAKLKTYEISENTLGAGDWEGDDREWLGFLAEFWGEYDYDTYQAQHPFVSCSITEGRSCTYFGLVSAIKKTGLPAERPAE